MEILGQYKPIEYKLENKSMGIMIHGADNLRSLVSENLIEKSPTASFCANLYSKFIRGAGFTGGEINISDKPYKVYTPNHLLNECAKDHSKNEGCFIHIRYNPLYVKVGFEKIPFSQCRFGLEDDNNYSGKIVRANKGWGKRAKKESFEIFDRYNPDPVVIQKQVELAGGWEYYKGQIMFIGEQDDTVYPKGKIEGVENFAHTENKMGVYYASTVERGFENIQIFEYVLSEDKNKNERLKESITGAMGLENSGKIIGLPYPNSTDLKEQTKYKFTPLVNDASPEKYEHFLSTCSTMIRAKWSIPVQLFEAVSGKLGNSTGEDLKVAQSMYNQTTADVRNLYEISFKELFTNFRVPINSDWKINQYSIMSDDGTIEETDSPKIEPTI